MAGYNSKKKKRKSGNVKSAEYNKKTIIIAVAIFVAVFLVFGGAYLLFNKNAANNDGNGDNVTGETKLVRITVVDNEEHKIGYTQETERKYLRELLDDIVEAGILEIEGEESEFGFYIKSVNGLRADFEKDNAYWALYTNGEYATNGVDSEPLHDGDEFTIKYEKAE